jgi:hypothetical protein
MYCGLSRNAVPGEPKTQNLQDLDMVSKLDEEKVGYERKP